MPGGDRTGPEGFGPMTGRAAGFCAGFGVPGYANPAGRGGGFGRGRGFRGRGGGRGWRNWFYATGIPGWARAGYGFSGPFAQAPTLEQELEGLKQQAEFLQENLREIKERMEELQSKPESQ